MKRLLIVGAGGLGRMLLAWLSDIHQPQDWSLGGFLDDDPDALVGRDSPVGVIAGVSHYAPREDDRFILAIGSPRRKLEVARQIAERGGEFITFVHPSALVGRGVTLGRGTVLGPYAVLTNDAEIGGFVLVNVMASIGHDTIIGPGCTLSSHSDVTGRARLGTGVFLGSHASVLPGAHIEDFAVVGAGSVVIKHVKAGATVCGVPARPI